MARARPHEDDADVRRMAAVDFDIGIPREDVDEMEKTAQAFGVDRRCALAILSCTKAEILSRSDRPPAEDAEMWIDLAERMTAYIAHLTAQLELAKSAQARMLCLAATFERRTPRTGRGLP